MMTLFEAFTNPIFWLAIAALQRPLTESFRDYFPDAPALAAALSPMVVVIIDCGLCWLIAWFWSWALS